MFGDGFTLGRDGRGRWIVEVVVELLAVGGSNRRG